MGKRQLTVLTVNDHTVQSSQGDDLGMSDGWNGDERQQGFFLISELVQESQTGILDRGSVRGRCRSWLDSHGE